jgi:3-hydroxymyristoyl/3-hydroxydecanoyl-(acyl carrier protein) dehydratase
MTASAHRISKIDFEIPPTFNLELDDHVFDFLENERVHYANGIYDIPLDVVKALIKHIEEQDPMVAGHFKKDLRWAELRNKESLMYYVIGDN